MLTLRRDLSKESALGAYPIARSFIFLEQYAVLITETIRNLTVASLAILVITSPFLVDLAVTLLVFLGFVALIFELFGLMFFWGVALNSISMINLVMAIGFSVDYSAHIAHSFLKSDETTPEKRVVFSLKNIGTSVALGGKDLVCGEGGGGGGEWFLCRILCLGQSSAETFFPVFPYIIYITRRANCLFSPGSIVKVPPPPNNVKQPIPKYISESNCGNNNNINNNNNNNNNNYNNNIN